MKTKYCPKCELWRPIDKFYMEWRGWVRRPSSYCIDCYKAIYQLRKEGLFGHAVKTKA